MTARKWVAGRISKRATKEHFLGEGCQKLDKLWLKMTMGPTGSQLDTIFVFKGNKGNLVNLVVRANVSFDVPTPQL